MEFTYAYKTGTSMAVPHVTAAAALLLSHNPDCSVHQIRYALAKTAKVPLETEEQERDSEQHYGTHPCNHQFGYGIPQIADAHDWLQSQGKCSEWSIPEFSRGGCTTL